MNLDSLGFHSRPVTSAPGFLKLYIPEVACLGMNTLRLVPGSQGCGVGGLEGGRGGTREHWREFGYG